MLRSLVGSEMCIRHRWYWRSCFSRRYSSGVNRAYATDIASMDALKANSDTDIAKFTPDIGAEFFIENRFNIQAVNTKIFISLLANLKPLSLLSGSSIKLEDALLRCNRNEFHHIFPKNHLISDPAFLLTNSLANFCFLSSADNQSIKDKPPGVYASNIPPAQRSAIEAQAGLPTGWEKMSFGDFLQARSEILLGEAKRFWT